MNLREAPWSAAACCRFFSGQLAGPPSVRPARGTASKLAEAKAAASRRTPRRFARQGLRHGLKGVNSRPRRRGSSLVASSGERSQPRFAPKAFEFLFVLGGRLLVEYEEAPDAVLRQALVVRLGE